MPSRRHEPSRLPDWCRSTFGQASAGAILLWAALPPVDWWPLAWIAPLWWVLLMRRQTLPGRHPYRALWLVGFLFWLAAYHWLRLPHWATSFGWIALSFYLAFYLPLLVGLGRVAVHRLRVPVILAAPVIWTGLELARAHVLTGITMASLGHTQYHWIELIQLSDLAGAFGVSFVVMFVAACLARMVPCDGLPRVLWPLVPAVAALGAALAYGYVRTSGQTTAPGPRVALIQGCIDARIKSDPDKRDVVFSHYLKLSQEAVRQYEDLDLIVWPETMYPDRLITYDENARVPDHPDYEDWAQEKFQGVLQKRALQTREEMVALARFLDTPLILGVARQHFGREDVRCFNSAVLVSPDGQFSDPYDKIHLVMFGEYVPFGGHAPWLQRLTPLPLSVAAGVRPVAFELGRLRIAPNICYETVLPHVIRRQVKTLQATGTEPDLLVNLTNSGWYWGSSELDMHLACGVFRAVECRKPLLIAANTGFSAWIDADGRIVRRGPRRRADTILAEVRLDRRASWYLEHGDWAAGLCLVACILLGAVGCWPRLRGLVGRSRYKPFSHNE